MLHLILPDLDQIRGRFPERLVAHLGREPPPKNTKVVVRNAQMKDEKQQGAMQVVDFGTAVVQMNWLNGSHVSPPLGMNCDVMLATAGASYLIILAVSRPQRPAGSNLDTSFMADCILRRCAESTSR